MIEWLKYYYYVTIELFDSTLNTAPTFYSKKMGQKHGSLREYLDANEQYNREFGDFDQLCDSMKNIKDKELKNRKSSDWYKAHAMDLIASICSPFMKKDERPVGHTHPDITRWESYQKSGCMW